MNNFRACAQSAVSFKRISGKRIRKKCASIVTGALNSNLLALNYPEVGVDGSIEKNEVIILKVTNHVTEEYMEFSMPEIDSNGIFTYKSVKFVFKSNSDGLWNVCFENYSFSSNLCNIRSEESIVKDLAVSGCFAGVSIASKMRLICSMVKKLEFFFLYSVEHSPKKLLDIICQALCIAPNNLNRFVVKIGEDMILKIVDGEIKAAMGQKKDFKVKVKDTRVITYLEKNFEFICNPIQEWNKVRFEGQFQKEFDVNSIDSKIKTAKKEINNLLEEIELCNQKMLVTVKRI